MFRPNNEFFLILHLSIVGIVDRWYHPLSNREQSIKNEFTDALVRVKMWRRNDMPPDFDSGFQYNLNTLTTMSTATTDRKSHCLLLLHVYQCEVRHETSCLI